MSECSYQKRWERSKQLPLDLKNNLERLSGGKLRFEPVIKICLTLRIFFFEGVVESTFHSDLRALGILT